MNRIVLEHYPVSKLPAELRDRLSDAATVRLVIEADDGVESGPSSPFAFAESKRASSGGLDDLLERYRKNPENFSGNVTVEEAVARIRELRDEWDDE